MWSLADYFTNADYVVVLLGQVVPVAHNGIGTFTLTYGICVGPYPSKFEGLQYLADVTI